jgi:hypothetical protein
MKRGKKLLVMFVALAAVTGAAVAAVRLNADDDTEESYSVFTLSTADITELKWSYNGETAALSYNGSKWSCADDSSFPLSQDLVKSMAASLADIKAVKTISSPDALSEYGLDEPVCDVTVKTDAEHEIKLGSETSLGGQYYISIGDGKVYIVPDSTLLDMFSRGLYDVIETESLPDMSDITAFAIKSGAGELSLVHKTGSGYTYSDNYEWFVSDGGSYTALDTSAVQELTGQITGLVWQKCVDYNAADRLASYGLASPAATVTVSYKDSDGAAASFVLEMGNSTDSGCYARISGSGMIYLVDSAVRNAVLNASVSALLPNEIISMDWSAVTDFDVTIGGKTHTVTVTQGTDAATYKLDGNTASTEAVQAVTDALDALTYSGSADKTYSGEAALSFTFRQKSVGFPKVTLSFFKCADGTYAAALNGKTEYVVSGSDYDALAALVNTAVSG